jgi:hypothetical protein
MLEFFTFLLAAIGYAGLALTAVIAAHRAVPAALLRLVAVIIASHVALVWAFRYEGQLGQATRNGYFGFLVFHTALLAVVGSVFVADRLARRLVIAAFGIVTIGAVGAVFRYEEVAMYRVPVILCAILGVGGLLHGHRTASLGPRA